MQCAHCCRDFGKGRPTQGQHMEEYVYLHCLDLCSELCEPIQLGGGEPASHPKFWEFFQYALRHDDECSVWLATSGHNPLRTLDLMQIAISGNETFLLDLNEFENEIEYDEESEYEDITQKGHDMLNALYHAENKFSMALSLDIFHDPIDERVVNFARNHKQIEIRNNYDKPSGLMDRGRAKENQMGNPEELTCEGIHADWKGNITLCSTCPDERAKLGNIVTDYHYIRECLDRMYAHDDDLSGTCKHHWTEEQWKAVRAEN